MNSNGKVSKRNDKVKILEERFRENDLKLTPQRRAILDVLIDNPSKHLNPEDIYELVKRKYPDIGLATIYRTVQLFDDFGVVKKLNFGDGCYRYELSEDNEHQHHHHHLICLKCGKVFEFEDDLLDNLEQKIKENNNFSVEDHVVKFYGYCENCQNKGK